VKVLEPGDASAMELAQVAQEVLLSEQLDHPNLVKTYTHAVVRWVEVRLVHLAHCCLCSEACAYAYCTAQGSHSSCMPYAHLRTRAQPDVAENTRRFHVLGRGLWLHIG
jgi:hypothetical protein